MKQMINIKAPAIQSMPFGQLECGFFRRSHGEKIFFAQPHGKWSFPFPVREDGLILRCGANDNFFPSEIVETIHPRSLGISEIKWEEN